MSAFTLIEDYAKEAEERLNREDRRIAKEAAFQSAVVARYEEYKKGSRRIAPDLVGTYEVEAFIHSLMSEIMDENATVKGIRGRLSSLLSTAAARSLHREASGGAESKQGMPDILREQAC